MSPSKDAVPPNLMNEQLQAELDRVQKLRREEREQWQNDNLGWNEVLREVSQQLVEEETAHQGEAWERICYRGMNEKLERQLDNFKSILSTLQEALIENPSAHIAEDPMAKDNENAHLQGHGFKEESKRGAERLWGQRTDPLVLGPETVTYSAQDVCECEQEWQEVHQKDLLDVQQWMQMQLDAQAVWYQRQENQGSVTCPPAGIALIGQPGLDQLSQTRDQP